MLTLFRQRLSTWQHLETRQRAPHRDAETPSGKSRHHDSMLIPPSTSPSILNTLHLEPAGTTLPTISTSGKPTTTTQHTLGLWSRMLPILIQKNVGCSTKLTLTIRGKKFLLPSKRRSSCGVQRAVHFGLCGALSRRKIILMVLDAARTECLTLTAL